LLCATIQNARQSPAFVVRHHKKRTAINGAFTMRPIKGTAKALIQRVVLVTLPCAFQKTHDKMTFAFFFVFHV
jgi:P2-related tail formation protein